MFPAKGVVRCKSVDATDVLTKRGDIVIFKGQAAACRNCTYFTLTMDVGILPTTIAYIGERQSACINKDYCTKVTCMVNNPSHPVGPPNFLQIPALHTHLASL